MCLHRISEEKLKKSGIGYKIVRRDFTTLIRSSLQKYLVGTTVEDQSKDYILTVDNYEYKSGYHIYLHVYDVKTARSIWEFPDLKIIKVRWSNPVCIGYESNFKVVVARKMEILEEISI